MVKETELEEGEARFDDIDANIDPDTALSSIDDRLQNVLGHFQKDFKNNASAETLGPKYGDYGSFLPSYKLPPSIHSHVNALSLNKSTSPNNFHFQGAFGQPHPVKPVKPAALYQKDVFVDKNVTSVDCIANKDASLLNDETRVSKREIISGNLVNPTEHRSSLKVRIKVGSFNPAIKKHEIYGGLGLLTPSSSISNNHEDNCNSAIESHDTYIDSANSILRDMSSIFIPGNRLLSPLNESLICLNKPLIIERIINSSAVDDSSSVHEKVMVTESVDCKQGLTNGFKVKPSSSSVTSEANRGVEKDASVKMRKIKKVSIKDQLFGSDSTSKESDESYKPKNVKKLSLDSRGIKLIVCKNDSNDIRQDPDCFENGGLKAIDHEPHEVKVSNNMTKLPSERKNKLTAINRKENSRSRISGPMKDKKSALKDIVKVRNSYKEILETDNEAIKVENFEKNAMSADVAVSQQTVVGPVVPPDNWVACDRCEKWRLLPIDIEPANMPDKWLCSMTTWLSGRINCDISEDETTKAVQELNLRLISQNQYSFQFNGTRGNLGNYDQKKTTSHSSMDIQQLSRLKRKSSSENNQPLLEKIDDVKPKKLKNKIRSEQYENVISKKVNNESEELNSRNGGYQPKDGLVISLKTQTESNLMDKKVEIQAKKRKLKDLQESQPLENGLENSANRIKRKEKRLKTEVKESIDDKCLNKGKSMKIKLSLSRENSVDTNHEKNQQQRYPISCQKDSEFAATSSSSVVSGSCKRVNLQERKGSVLSSPINLDKNSLLVGEENISRKVLVRSEIPKKDNGGKVVSKHKETSKIRNNHNLEHTTDANGTIDKYEIPNFERVKVQASDSLSGQLNKTRRVEADVSVKIINDGKIVGIKRSGSEAKLGDISSQETNPNVKKNLKKVSVDSNEVQTFDHSGQNRSKVMKLSGVAANQNAKVVTDCGKNLSVISFLKEFASGQSQTALTAFKKAEESKDYADRLKISGFDYECNNAYFDSALKFLCAASLLETCTADISKLKGVDAISVYTTSAKLSKICALEYEKKKEMFASSLAYKCMEVACMRIVYCKDLLTKQDLQTSMQMVTQGESPSSSASDVDNLNNQATMDKTIMSKSITHHKNDVFKNQANLMRLLDLTSDVSLAMEASMKSRNAFKSASAILEEEQTNKEMIITVKRVVNFSFQDVKEFACLVQNAREVVNRHGNKRQ